MRPTVTVGARFRWVSRSDAGGRAAGGIGESGLQGRLNQVSISILGDKVASCGVFLWSRVSESLLATPWGLGRPSEERFGSTREVISRLV